MRLGLASMTLLNVDAGMVHAHLNHAGLVDVPLSFARPLETPDQQTRKVRLQVGYTPKNPNGSYNNTSIYYSELKDEGGQPIGEITLHRPPVLLVHGLWSDHTTWSSGYVNPTPAEGRLVDSEFDYPNAAPFAASTPRLQERIKKILKEMRKGDEENEPIAATQVDLIAHSMGTLLSRSWLTHSEYLRPDNFKEGDVRKLASLTAPYTGSQLGNLLINLHQNFTSHFPVLSAMWWMETLLGDFHQGAVCDLAENSWSLGFPGSTGARGLAYTATGGVQGDLHWPLSFFKVFFTGSEEAAHISPYVFQIGQFNDGLVAVTSQQGGLPGQNYDTLVHSDRLSGVGITKASGTAAQLYAQLDNAAGFSSGFPQILSANNGIPFSVPGRGSVDADNFLNQCSAGGPMNQGAGAAALRTQLRHRVEIT